MSESKDSELHSLLSAAAAKERQAYKRATRYIAVPVVIGLLLVAFSVYGVIWLEHKRDDLKGQIGEAQKELKSTQAQTTAFSLKTDELMKTLKEVQDSLHGPGGVQEALKILDKVPARPVVERPVVTLPPVTTGGKESAKATVKGGKFNDNTYTGKDKTNITVDITTAGAEIRVYYTLDGKSEYIKLDGKSTKYSFDFTLDASKHNPSFLLINFNFYPEKNELVKGAVRITDSYHVSAVYTVAQTDKANETATRGFKFFVDSTIPPGLR